jgi:hypothetical protein
VVSSVMARILPLVGVLEITPFYQRAWLFEPFFFLRRGTAEVTTTGMVITPAPRRCQAGMEGALALVGKKVLALNGLTPDQQDICSATLSPEVKWVALHSVHLTLRLSCRGRLQRH